MAPGSNLSFIRAISGAVAEAGSNAIQANNRPQPSAPVATQPAGDADHYQR